VKCKEVVVIVTVTAIATVVVVVTSTMEFLLRGSDPKLSGPLLSLYSPDDLRSAVSRTQKLSAPNTADAATAVHKITTTAPATAASATATNTTTTTTTTATLEFRIYMNFDLGLTSEKVFVVVCPSMNQERQPSTEHIC
jgi:hypothetical protein